jgi:hypothetical protein
MSPHTDLRTTIVAWRHVIVYEMDGVHGHGPRDAGPPHGRHATFGMPETREWHLSRGRLRQVRGDLD